MDFSENKHRYQNSVNNSALVQSPIREDYFYSNLNSSRIINEPLSGSNFKLQTFDLQNRFNNGIQGNVKIARSKLFQRQQQRIQKMDEMAFENSPLSITQSKSHYQNNHYHLSFYKLNTCDCNAVLNHPAGNRQPGSRCFQVPSKLQPE